MNLKKTALISACLICSMTGAAHANSVTLTFQGTVTSVGADITGGGISVNDGISGEFTYALPQVPIASSATWGRYFYTDFFAFVGGAYVENNASLSEYLDLYDNGGGSTTSDREPRRAAAVSSAAHTEPGFAL